MCPIFLTDKDLVLGQAGRVLVRQGGVWKYVCSDGWNQAAASVVCRELGYRYARAYTRLNNFVPVT